jgi:hypothetical protein
MRTSWRKRALIAICLLAMLGIGAYVGLHVLVGFACANEIIQVFPSPDGTNKAVLYRRSCGATTGWSRQVVILPRWRSVRSWSWPDPVFATEDYITVQPAWNDATHLSIVYGPMGHQPPGWVEGGTDRLTASAGAVKISYHYVP